MCMAACLPRIFDRVGVLRELLCVRYGYCSQALLSSDKMDFIVQVFVFAVTYTGGPKSKPQSSTIIKSYEKP